jgi:hypothetical protein
MQRRDQTGGQRPSRFQLPLGSMNPQLSPQYLLPPGPCRTCCREAELDLDLGAGRCSRVSVCWRCSLHAPLHCRLPCGPGWWEVALKKNDVEPQTYRQPRTCACICFCLLDFARLLQNIQSTRQGRWPCTYTSLRASAVPSGAAKSQRAESCSVSKTAACKSPLGSRSLVRSLVFRWPAFAATVREPPGGRGGGGAGLEGGSPRCNPCFPPSFGSPQLRGCG